jgi:hypothetical protein
MKADDCYKSKNHDSADLCAQWRAALAAEKAAERALWNNWISAIAAFFSLVSVLLVIHALRQTDRSLIIAQRERASSTRRAVAGANDTATALATAKQNAETAAAHIQIAKDAAERELRAYLNPENIIVTDFVVGKRPCFQFKPANSGKTPAYKFRSSVLLIWTLETDPHDVKVFFRGSMSEGSGSCSVVAPGEGNTVDFGHAMVLGSKDVEAVMDGTMLFLFCGILSYYDAFGRRRLSTFKTYLRPELLSKKGFAPLSNCERGNNSN